MLAGALAAGLLAACAALTLAASPPRPPAGRPGRVTTPLRLAAHPSSRRPRPPAPARLPRRRGSSSSCGFLDVSCEIGNAITSWFAALARDALRPLLTLAGQTLLSSPQPGAIPAVHAMWATSLAIADSAYVLLAVIGGVIVMGHETLQTSYSAKDIAPRLVTGFLAANLSLVLISRATTIANALSAALAGDGVTPATAASALLGTLTAPLPGGGIFLVLLALAGAVLALVLAVVYVLRLMALVLLTAAAPLALAALCAAADRVGGPLVVAGPDRVPGHPGSAGAGADRGGAGVLLRRVDPPARHPRRQRAAGADRDLPAVHHDADPLVDQPPRAVGLRPQPHPPDRQVRLLRRRPVPRQPPAARRSRGQASPLRRAAAGAAGQPGHAGQARRATRRRHRAGHAGTGPAGRAGTARRHCPGRGQPAGTGPGRVSQAAPGRSGQAAARDPAAVRAGPGRHRGDLAGARGPGPRRPAGQPPGPARPRSSEPGRPHWLSRSSASPGLPAAAAGHAAARAARHALRGDPRAAQRRTSSPAGPAQPQRSPGHRRHARPPPSPAARQLPLPPARRPPGSPAGGQPLPRPPPGTCRSPCRASRKVITR